MELNDSLGLFLAERSQRSLLLLTALTVVLIGLFDYFSGPTLSVSTFYLLPVGLASWYISGRVGMVTAVVCAIVWLLNDVITGPLSADSLLPYWSATVRLATFVLVAYVLSSLRESRRRQEELFAFVVHDLRTPLMGVLSSLEMVRSINSTDGSEEVAELVDMGMGAGNELLVLIDTLLDVARLESKQMPVNLQPTPVDSVVREAVGQVSAVATLQDVEIALHGVAEGQVAMADGALLRRVLANLLSNALRYSPKNSTIRIGSRPVEGGGVQITVSDEGPGIPSKWRGKAFDKFSQVQARKEGSRLGSGLGLTFCRMAIEAQGGEIWLESGQGSGTAVRVTLPGGGEV